MPLFYETKNKPFTFFTNTAISFDFPIQKSRILTVFISRSLRYNPIKATRYPNLKNKKKEHPTSSDRMFLIKSFISMYYARFLAPLPKVTFKPTLILAFKLLTGTN